MTKLKTGDKFIPRKPNHYNIANLRNYWNCTYTVRGVSNEWVIARENGLLFHVDWCEKVEEHIPEPSKTIDWEQRRYEIAKECLAAQINGVISADISWDDLAMVKYSINAADELIKQLRKSSEN